MKHLWGSRFSKEPNKITNDFNSSLSFDKRLYKYDIEGSIAHVKMLSAQNILQNEETEKIIQALNEILIEIEQEKLQFDFELEDIHTQIEKFLISKTGESGKKVHTARSRNDQVALDIRMFLKDEIKDIQNLIINLEKTLLKLSKENLTTFISGYTHLQRAQVVTLAHYFGAYIEMFKRDFERLNDTSKRVNILPLGACALAGTTHAINRYKTAEILDFSDVCLNSIDAVSDRDFIIEIMSNFSILMMHLSRFCEELILWSSSEFNFIEFSDEFSTGSSIMPQKKNPDIAELIRGKTGRIYGNLVSILTIMKALPLAYNKDMQEDKEGLFNSIDTVKACLTIFPEMLNSMKINKEKMFLSVKEGFLNATEVADYLVNKGVAFRNAHEIAGLLVSYCISKEKRLDDLTLEEYREKSELFDADIYKTISPETAVNKRIVIGSPSVEAVTAVISLNEEWIKKHEKD